MELATEQREWVRRSEALIGLADEDGIVCISPVRGEASAGERLLSYLAASFGDAWSDGVLTSLLTEVGARTLDDWLRHRFFEQHCKLFHDRPFVWHIWDGRRDGFHALVNYHKLAAGDGKGRQLLESLTYSYLGDWISRQRDGVTRGDSGAEGRRDAALELQKRLVAIREGEPPFDIFVRWEAHRPTTHRLGTGHQRWRASQHPTVHGRRHPWWQAGCRDPALQTEHPLAEGPRQGACKRGGPVSVVLEQWRIHGRPRQRREPVPGEKAICPGTAGETTMNRHHDVPNIGARWWNHCRHPQPESGRKR